MIRYPSISSVRYQTNADPNRAAYWLPDLTLDMFARDYANFATVGDMVLSAYVDRTTVPNGLHGETYSGRPGLFSHDTGGAFEKWFSVVLCFPESWDCDPMLIATLRVEIPVYLWCYQGTEWTECVLRLGDSGDELSIPAISPVDVTTSGAFSASDAPNNVLDVVLSCNWSSSPIPTGPTRVPIYCKYTPAPKVKSTSQTGLMLGRSYSSGRSANDVWYGFVNY